MHVVRPVDGGRVTAGLEVPTGTLAIAARSQPPIRLSLIVPTYNESRNLEELIGQLTAVLEPRLAGHYEIIIVDDDSPDRTWEIALGLAERWPMLRVLRRSGE